MLDQIDASAGSERHFAFEELVRKLAVHETAEEEVVHPALQAIGARDIADTILHEEDSAKKSLAALDGADVLSDDFATQFGILRPDVIAHAQHEETDEHPRLLQDESPEKLERLGRLFAIAERTAPTRPHPAAPESRVGNLLVGPILAVSDRVRDAIRNAQRDE